MMNYTQITKLMSLIVNR